jgi:tRNA threonylcarbamoyladenosine biosynthesis protein TsaE
LQQQFVLMTEWIFTLSTINETAAMFWQVLGQYKVFAFFGQMGAGKTSFIHALCNAKQVNSTTGSPTFSIINEYSYPGGTINHIDLYRLKDEEEAIRAGIEDALYSGNICLVEWPERIPGLFPENTVNIYIEIINEYTRRISVEHK